MHLGFQYALPVSALCVALGLAACAPISEDECRAGDWDGIGYEDGVAGKSADRLVKYRETCAAFGVAPDAKRYGEGRTRGLTLYCTPTNAYSIARRGGRVSGVCSAELAAAMAPAAAHGKNWHRLETEINALEREIGALTERRSRLRDGEITEQVAGQLREIRWELSDARRDIERLRDRQEAYDTWPPFPG